MIDNKILENAAMNDDELDNVVGGTGNEFDDDIEKFRELGIECEEFSRQGARYDLSDFNSLTRRNVMQTFNKFGVECSVKWGNNDANKYYIGGKQVSREKAWEHVYSQINK